MDLKARGPLSYLEVRTLFPDADPCGPELDQFLAGIEQSRIDFLPAPELTADAEHPGLALTVPDAGPMLDGDPIQVYVYLAAQVPPLAPEREAQLAGVIAANTSGRKAAMKELGEANLMLVIEALRRFRVLAGHHALDLIVQGNTGLIQATKTFRPGRGYGFSTYASFFIHRALDELLRRK